MYLDPIKNINGFLYIATPYSKYPHGKEQANIDACKFAAILIGAGIPCFSPIAHSHAIAQLGGIDPDSHAIWLPADQPFIDRAAAIVVVMMDGWRDSYGVSYEIDQFTKAEKPIFYLSPRVGIVNSVHFPMVAPLVSA